MNVSVEPAECISRRRVVAHTRPDLDQPGRRLDEVPVWGNGRSIGVAGPIPGRNDDHPYRGDAERERCEESHE